MIRYMTCPETSPPRPGRQDRRLRLCSPAAPGIGLARRDRPNHTERSLAGPDGPSRAHGLIKKYGDPERMAAWNYLEPASFGGAISLKLITALLSHTLAKVRP